MDEPFSIISGFGCAMATCALWTLAMKRSCRVGSPSAQLSSILALGFGFGPATPWPAGPDNGSKSSKSRRTLTYIRRNSGIHRYLFPPFVSFFLLVPRAAAVDDLPSASSRASSWPWRRGLGPDHLETLQISPGTKFLEMHSGRRARRQLTTGTAGCVTSCNC